MLWHTALCTMALLTFTGCRGISKPLLFEPVIRECNVLELDRVQSMPAKEAAWISFCIPDSGHTNLRVLDESNKLIAIIVDTMLCGGEHQFLWNPLATVSGECYLKLAWRSNVRMKKFLVR